MSDTVNEQPERRALDGSLEKTTMRKVTLRLIPFLFVLYIINMLDRTNVGMAKLQMQPDLGISDAAYGTGAGLFFVGYFLFEVPSNLILSRVGARKWIARILMSWGVVSCCMMFVRGEKSFYAMRVLLGATEAGFFPGIILYLSQWFPAREQARAVARFMAASAVTTILGNPISGRIMDKMNGVAGLGGWQWVFLIEGLPAVIMGLVTLFYLTDRPRDAHWLKPDERDWLVDRLSVELDRRETGHGKTLLATLSLPRVWLLTGVYFSVATTDNTFTLFLPTFLKSHFKDSSDFQIGLLAALTCLSGLGAMILVGMHSDRTGERRWHVACAAFAATTGWILAAFAPTPWTFLFALALASVGMKSMLPCFWTLPMRLLSGAAAAGGIAIINSIANLGGFAGSHLMGKVEPVHGMLAMSQLLFVGGILVLFARHDARSDEMPAIPAPARADAPAKSELASG